MQARVQWILFTLFLLAIPVSEKADGEVYENMVRNPFDFVINNFENIAIKNNTGSQELSNLY